MTEAPLSPSPRPGRSPRELAVLGAALVAGWVTHDLVVFTSSGWPSEARHLVPVSALLVLGGALVGAVLAGRPRLFRVLLGLAALSAVLPVLLEVEASPVRRLLPRAVSTLLVAGLVVRALVHRFLFGWLRSGWSAGLLASVLFAHARGDLPEVSAWLALVPVAALVAGLLRRRAARRLATGVLLAAPLVFVLLHARSLLALPRADLAAPVEGAPGGAPSLFLVVLDTVRADHLGSYGYERDTMPRLDGYAAQHMTRYTRARSTSSWTLPSHASLFTGLMPAQHGVTHPRTEEDRAILLASGFAAYPLRAETTTLAERLRALGYRTGAVFSNAATLRVEYGLARGFEHYDVRRACWVRGYLALAQLAGGPLWVGHRPYRDATTITDAALDWVASTGNRPFFLALNYMEAHLPYLPPAPFDRAFGDSRPVDPLAPRPEERALQYDRELAYLDSELGRLFETLAARGALDDTVVVVTSDHGESFGEHGLWKHDWTLYEELVHVPLFVAPVGGRRTAVDPTPISGPGVHDLVLRELGLEDAAGAVAQAAPVSEWYHLPSIPLFADEGLTKESLARDLVAWVDGDEKLIVSSDGAVELYDLARDPDELSSATLAPERIEAERARAARWWEENPPPSDRIQGGLGAEGPGEDRRGRLRKLGYLEEDTE
jgi:arylsulfatase A-like enzyme